MLSVSLNGTDGNTVTSDEEFEIYGEREMAGYNFYGAENANITDSRGLTPRDYYDILSEIWCAETCAPRMRRKWTPENKTLGQCSITAFLIQDLFGGKVYGLPREGGTVHCFNNVDGHIFDLTSEQFGDEVLDYSNCQEQDRNVHFAKEEKRLRYELLRTGLEKSIPSAMDYIVYEGTKYPVRDIRLSEYEVDVKVSCASLESIILDEEGEYTSREAQLIDEIMFFYVPDNMITDSGDEELERYITENLEW